MSKEKPSAELRRFVEERACCCCEYCRSQVRFSPEMFSIEHILPRSRGGETVENNLALACQGCNNHKHNKTTGRDPATGDVVPLFDPRRQRWRDHFSWAHSFTHIVGLTPTGRATVTELQLNREGVVNLRRALHTVKEHPPPEPQEP